MAIKSPMKTQETKPETTAPLAPCPFCGLTDKDSVAPDAYIAAISSHSYPGGYRVECEGCGCNGPLNPEHSAALTAWNNRPND